MPDRRFQRRSPIALVRNVATFSQERGLGDDLREAIFQGPGPRPGGHSPGVQDLAPRIRISHPRFRLFREDPLGFLDNPLKLLGTMGPILRFYTDRVAPGIVGKEPNQKHFAFQRDASSLEGAVKLELQRRSERVLEAPHEVLDRPRHRPDLMGAPRCSWARSRSPKHPARLTPSSEIGPLTLASAKRQPLLLMTLRPRPI